MSNHQSYDYVIAGGGTAGCVLANRLTKDPNIHVLLLEAGPKDRHPMIHMPIGFGFLAGLYDWKYFSTPQKHCQNREISLTQAKVIGGGGSINAQVFTRGAANDYDEWATTYQCEGWSFKEIQPYFIRSEGNGRLSAPWHGTDGPLGVSDLPQLHPLTEAFVEAGKEMGLPFNDDFNGESQLGVGPYQTTTKNGRRCSAAIGYLRPAMSRPNLTVKTGVLTTRIILDGKRAIGVEVIEEQSRVQYNATREVLVTSGAIGSPKLLLLSGIGDPTHLKDVGIEVKAELPGVGQNLHDHCDVDIIYELNQLMSIDQYKNISLKQLKIGLEYLLTRRGLAASTVVEGGAFSFANNDEKTPDLQFHFLPAAGVEAGVAGVRPGYGCTLNSYFVRPRSRGSVQLASSNPSQAPLIDPNYLADDYDFEISVEGLKQSREMMAQPAMAKYIKREHAEGGELKTKEDLQRYVRAFGRTSYHHVGTCKMGQDDAAVVSPELKVYGVEGLRVCDSSVMPRIISSNTQAPTVMIAEKASDMILGTN